MMNSLYTAATYIGGLDDDQVSGSTPTFGTLLCLCEESIGGKGSDEKVRFGIVSAQPSTGEVIYDGEKTSTKFSKHTLSPFENRIRRWIPSCRA